jgi:hypothetical protein
MFIPVDEPVQELGEINMTFEGDKNNRERMLHNKDNRERMLHIKNNRERMLHNKDNREC